jgi:hypothetical protein
VVTQVVNIEEDLYKTANILNGIKDRVRITHIIVVYILPYYTPSTAGNCTLDLGLREDLPVAPSSESVSTSDCD